MAGQLLIQHPSSPSQLIPYIFAQWWSPQRDTLLALPGNSEFVIQENPQDPPTYGDGNITGIWWIDERLLPGKPFDLVLDIDLNIDCASLRRDKNPLSPKAGDVFAGSIAREISFERAVNVERSISGRNIQIPPNPFQDRPLIKIPDFERTCSAQVFDLTGKRVYEEEVPSGNWVCLDLGSLPEGGYRIRLIGSESHTSKMIVKIK